MDKDEIDELLDMYRSSQMQFFVKTLCKPTYQPLKRINDNLYLFNYLENKLVKYNLDGVVLSEIPIEYAKNDKNWEKEIVVNEEQTRCFVKFVHKGIATLKEIDLETGKLKIVLY